MRTVILGAGGQLAHDLAYVLEDWDLDLLSHGDLDICHYDEVEETLNDIKPNVVINTAAFVRVDDCEEEVETAFQVNAFAVRNLARVCGNMDAQLMHISTDYVFGGEKRSPYEEGDAPNPLSVYGASKLTGEYFARNLCPRHYVVRSSGLYGTAGSSGKGGNFVETMLRLAQEGKTLQVVDDQVLAPTSTRELAGGLRALLEGGAYGLYHLTNRGACSWFEFAREIFRLTGLNADLRRTTSEAYGARAERPAYSVLSNQKAAETISYTLSPWEEALHDYLKASGHI